MKDNWWNKKAEEIEKFGECNNLQGLYFALKTVYGPKANSVAPAKNADGTQLFTDKRKISDRWKEHFYHLLNQEGNVDNDATDHLTARETKMHVNDPITMEKLRKAVKAANIGKAPGLGWHTS